MGLRDALFGRKKLSEPRDDRLFALTTAAVTLDVELGLKTAGRSAVVYKPLSSGDFTRVDSDVEQLIKAAGRSAGSEVERKTDSFGYEWLLVYDDDLEDQVTSVHAVAQQLTEQGFGAQLLAAPFLFKGGERPVYWIYGFKRGAFWPFVPTGEDQKRDNATELELKAKLEKELPVEQDLTRWLALFDSPIAPN
jgi:PspA associated protein B